MTYAHTQTGRFHWLLVALSLIVLVLVVALGLEWPMTVVLPLAATLFLFLAASFAQLTVRDGGDALEVRFGPLPLMRKRVPYATIRGASAERSRFIDGWGVHWLPGRGWTWNLWGYDCVGLELEEGRHLRIGTDDPEGLLSHLRQRLDV